MTGATTHVESTRKPDEERRVLGVSAITGALLWAGALLLYAYTSAPGIVELFDDSLEFQTVAPTFGIAHPTGYPLYTIGGGLWSRVLFPFGNWAWRMNLFSAVAAATAVLFVYMAAARLVPSANTNRHPDSWAGLVAATAFAFGPTWWGQATVAEVYALHNLFVAAILLTTLTIPTLFTASHSPDQGEPWVRRVALLFLLFGLSLAHHRTTLLLAPGVAIYLLWSVPGLWRPRREWFLWIGALLLPLALYLYLPLRAAQGVTDLNESYANTVDGFVNHVLARGYVAFFESNALGEPRSVSDAVRLMREQQGLVVAALAMVGLVVMPFHGKAARKNWSLLLLVLGANLVFALRYQVADWKVFFLPVSLILALYAGGGTSVITGALGSRPRLATLSGAALTLLVLAGVIARGAPVNRSDDWGAHQTAYLMASVDYPAGSRVVGLEGEMTALKYMQASDHMAAQAVPVTADRPAARADAIEQSVAAGNPTYITRELAGIEDRYSFSGEGPLVRVWQKGQSESEPAANSLNVELLAGQLRLVGYEQRALDIPGGRVLELALDWLPIEPLERPVKISLRLQDAVGNPLVDASGEPVAVDEFPLRQVAPSTTWLPRELVRDVHYVPIPDGGSPAQLQVIVYDAETVEEFARFELPAP